jgi:hypothetical protein
MNTLKAILKALFLYTLVFVAYYLRDHINIAMILLGVGEMFDLFQFFLFFKKKQFKE